MAAVFQQALGPVQPPQPSPEESAYQRLMAELAAQPQAQPNMFTPEQVAERINNNNALSELGVVGQLAGAEDIRGLGGQVFKKALADRAERLTNRGVQDPLTGETAVDPEYAREQEQERRGQILKQALGYEDRRQRAEERKTDRENQHQYRLAEIAARGTGRAPVDPELQDLKKDLIRAQIAGADSRVAAADNKQQEKIDKATSAAAQAQTRAADISSKIEGVLGRVGFLNSGMTGALLSKVPGSGAFDLRKDIDTIKANIGFQELQAMRQASPTGGALGQVAVKELDMLQAVLGNLDANQSRGQLEANLKAVKKHFDNWASYVAQAAAEEKNRSPAPAAGGAGTPAPAGQAPGAAPSPADPLGLRARRPAPGP